MQLSRFLQILLLRDVLMYLMPGASFIALLGILGVLGSINQFAADLQANVGDFMFSSMLIGIAYSTGYLIHNFSAGIARKFSSFSLSGKTQEGDSDSETKEIVSSFTGIAENLTERVAGFVGAEVMKVWSKGVEEELATDSRGVRYIRYLCEMIVMDKYPEIHHLTIERRSALKNFQLSLSGILFIAGVIGVSHATPYLVMQQGPALPAVIGALMVLVGLLVFAVTDKDEEQLRISIWRAFHAMTLIEDRRKLTSYSGSTPTPGPNDSADC